MNGCFEKFLDFEKIMSDELDRIEAIKTCTFSNSIKITQKNVFFFLISSNFQSSYETKKFFMKKIMGLILDEVIMSNRHLLHEQIYSFLQLFFNTEKIRLN